MTLGGCGWKGRISVAVVVISISSLVYIPLHTSICYSCHVFVLSFFLILLWYSTIMFIICSRQFKQYQQAFSYGSTSGGGERRFDDCFRRVKIVLNQGQGDMITCAMLYEERGEKTKIKHCCCVNEKGTRA